MAKEKLNYTEAMSQIEEILHKFNNENLDIDTLSDEVKRATELITLCKGKLLKAEQSIEKILKE